MPATAPTPACSTDRVGLICWLPRFPGQPRLEQSRRHRIFPERHANQIGPISGPEFPHHLGAMAFEGPVADLHPHSALLVGTAFGHEAKNLVLARRQRLSN